MNKVPCPHGDYGLHRGSGQNTNIVLMHLGDKRQQNQSRSQGREGQRGAAGGRRLLFWRGQEWSRKISDEMMFDHRMEGVGC